MLDAILQAVEASKLMWPMWYRAQRYLRSLFSKPSPLIPDRVVLSLSPYVAWGDELCDEAMVSRWAAATLATPHTEDVSRSVVDTLLQIAMACNPQLHIPTHIWAWLKERPSLPPVCLGRNQGNNPSIVRRIRSLKDVEILKSYFLVIWSEWEWLHDSDNETHISVSEDFGGISREMWSHREDLVERVDYILRQLDRGWEHLKQYNPLADESHVQAGKIHYEKLRNTLLKVDREAMEALLRTFPQSTHLNNHSDPHGRNQDPVLPSAVLYLFRVPDLYSEQSTLFGYACALASILSRPPLLT